MVYLFLLRHLSDDNKRRRSPASNPDRLEVTEELIRTRAYETFEQRGCENGHDMDDWLQAEAELKEQKPACSADKISEAKVATAA